MEIRILGTGCPNCKRLEKATRQALDEMGVEATVIKVTDMMDILSRRRTTPFMTRIREITPT